MNPIVIVSNFREKSSHEKKIFRKPDNSLFMLRK